MDELQLLKMDKAHLKSNSASCNHWLDDEVKELLEQKAPESCDKDGWPEEHLSAYDIVSWDSSRRELVTALKDEKLIYQTYVCERQHDIKVKKEHEETIIIRYHLQHAEEAKNEAEEAMKDQLEDEEDDE